jgi:MraZ protein
VERRLFRRSAIIVKVEIMFLGQYEHSIDEKGRMTIPVRFRELLSDGAYITHGLDKNLLVLTPSIFDQIYQSVNQMNQMDPNARNLKRLFFGNAEKVDVDKAGRILIPQFLRQSALLDGSAIVVGVGNFFEVWSTEAWEKQTQFFDNVESDPQRFGGLNLSLL